MVCQLCKQNRGVQSTMLYTFYYVGVILPSGKKRTVRRFCGYCDATSFCILLQTVSTNKVYFAEKSTNTWPYAIKNPNALVVVK